MFSIKNEIVTVLPNYRDGEFTGEVYIGGSDVGRSLQQQYELKNEEIDELCEHILMATTMFLLKRKHGFSGK